MHTVGAGFKPAPTNTVSLCLCGSSTVYPTVTRSVVFGEGDAFDLDAHPKAERIAPPIGRRADILAAAALGTEASAGHSDR